MLPFRPHFRPGQPVHGEVVYAVKKAIVAGALRPGDLFPSVRGLSQELKVNPNTAHKIITTLIRDGHLEVRPGIGTVVTEGPSSTSAQRNHLLDEEVERLVVEARRLNLNMDDVLNAVKSRWVKLS